MHRFMRRSPTLVGPVDTERTELGKSGIFRTPARALVRVMSVAFTALALVGTMQSLGTAAQAPTSSQKAASERAKHAQAVHLTSVPPGKLVPVYGPIRVRALESRSNTAPAVQEFVDEIFRQTGFDSAASSLRRRIASAELLYRQGCHPAIELSDLVRGINATSRKLNLPAFFKTTRSQVTLQQLYATALAPGAWAEGEGQAVSPSQAAFILLFLSYQKIWNGGYQVDAERWAQQQRALMANRPDPAFLRLQRRRPTRPDLTRDYTYLRSELARENSEPTRTAHALFDDIGIAR